MVALGSRRLKLTRTCPLRYSRQTPFRKQYAKHCFWAGHIQTRGESCRTWSDKKVIIFNYRIIFNSWPAHWSVNDSIKTCRENVSWQKFNGVLLEQEVFFWVNPKLWVMFPFSSLASPLRPLWLCPFYGWHQRKSAGRGFSPRIIEVQHLETIKCHVTPQIFFIDGTEKEWRLIADVLNRDNEWLVIKYI